MKHLWVIAFVLVVVAGGPATAATQPNIVMIISDDHAWTDYSFMGHPHLQTPNLDRLASESLTFTHGYVPSSLCCPSLATVISGLYPHQHKVTSNDPPILPGTAARNFQQSQEFTAGRAVMIQHLEAVPTLPRLLGRQGYLSLQTGKWWQGNYRHGGFTHGMTRGDRHGDDGLEIGRKTMQPIYDFIANAGKAGKPFFVWYAPLMPHEPHTPPERFLNRTKAVAPSSSVASYWAMVEWFDKTVGDLLGHLDRQGLAENTIVVYLADNGWIQNPDGPRYAPKSKQSPYDGGVRTPIMVRWPGKIQPRRCEELAISIDLVPTLLAALGQKPDVAMQGVNLADEQAVKVRTTIFGECFTHNAVDLNRPADNLRWRWTIADHWKLIVPDPKNEPDQIVELYDLAEDPRETTNLATRQGERVERLRATLDAWWNPGRDKP